jgi:pimeloyl-ACP methyl ester carboxylesterase
MGIAAKGLRGKLLAFVTVAMTACASCERPTVIGLGECVVLLHGLARTSRAMEPLADALTSDGYIVENIDYPSRDYTIEELAPMAVGDGIEACRQNGSAPTVHFVTHSLGGILVRQYFADNDLDRLGRVVMLGPPNQGSNAADAMRGVPGFEWLNGPAGFQLGKGEESVPLRLGPPDFEFAVIAGNRTIDPVTSQFLENPDDGRVSVEDTRLEGMSDFRVIDASHAFIMQDEEAFLLARNFLRYGSFDSPQ